MGMTLDDILEHHGIKGMKWGHRKDQAQRQVKRKVKQIKSERKVKAKRQKIITGRRRLSDAAIKEHIERFQSEKRLKDLVEADIKPGRTVTKKILSESGQKVARTVVAGGALLVVKAALDKKMGNPSNMNENLGLLSENIKGTLRKKKP